MAGQISQYIRLYDGGCHGGSFHFACQKVFSQLTPWVDDSTLVDNSTHYIKRQTRTCESSLLGKPPGCEGPLVRLYTYIWVVTKLDYFQAKKNCLDGYSAKLFDDFDGKQETVQFLVEHMYHSSSFDGCWVGLTDQVREGMWITDAGQNMNSYFQFEPVSSPSSSAGADYLTIMAFGFTSGNQVPVDIFADSSADATLGSVCYKISDENA